MLSNRCLRAIDELMTFYALLASTSFCDTAMPRQLRQYAVFPRHAGCRHTPERRYYAGAASHGS